jgi:predicted unusual protein kinase regulating ubiquinone biosynthesis (AarF/ABC1/UbiB family)
LEPINTRINEYAVSDLAGGQVNWRRYRRTLRFAIWLFIRIAFWELVLRRLAGEIVVGRGRSRRMRRWARDFRHLATDMGGVMIKLGQFISSRLDVLPPEVIEELATLQDEVPTVPFDFIRQTLEKDLGPLTDHFAAFDPLPVAAASLGQAHRAQLPDGERVVVKIQRPGIETLVNTDLRALKVVAGWLMRFRFIARRANVPALLDEFSRVLWEELNYLVEAEHVERFRHMFADDMGIYVPRLYDEYSTRRVLTLEDVTAIKITNYEEIEAAGVNRQDVARRLINTYLWMVFVQRFFHADPHPGNLFVYPLPPDIVPPTGRHRHGPELQGRPFYLVFVDFGMTGCLTPEITAGLTETLIALTTRDARRLVQSYQKLGILLPGADLDRIEEAARASFDRVWGLNMSQISNMPMSEMAALGREFSDLLFEMPFQAPQDFVVLARTVGILTGMCTGLDPQYDPWHEIQPFVQKMMAENGEFLALLVNPRDLLRPRTIRALLAGNGTDALLGAGAALLRRTIQLPMLAEDVLRRADRGELTVQVKPSRDMDRQIRRMENAAQRLVSAVMFTGLAIGSAVLYSAGERTLSIAGLALTVFTFLRVVLASNTR